MYKKKKKKNKRKSRMVRESTWCMVTNELSGQCLSLSISMNTQKTSSLSRLTAEDNSSIIENRQTHS